jgi:hypothetical protein
MAPLHLQGTPRERSLAPATLRTVCHPHWGLNSAQMEVIWLRVHTDFTNNYVMLVHTHSHITSFRVPFPLMQPVPRSENGSRPEGTWQGIWRHNQGPRIGPQTTLGSHLVQHSLPKLLPHPSCKICNIKETVFHLKPRKGYGEVSCDTIHPAIWPVSRLFHGPRTLAVAPQSSNHSQMGVSTDCHIPGLKTPRGRELFWGSETLTMSSRMFFFPILWDFPFS